MKREQFAMAGLAQALSRVKEEHLLYEDFYGLSEEPFSLTPDPKFFYRSESHGNAFDVLQYAIRRREGFVVITGDSGTGKTTLCRAILDQLDRRTFTALVLNPFVSEEDLLRLILQDFGVVSREDVRRGRLAGVGKPELINTLNDFLHSIRSIGGRAMLIVDEAQNLPLQLLEQIRLLSNLETDKDKLLQIVLVGQLSLKETLRSRELRQLDQRVSVRYQLRPLTPEETAAYVFHRLTIAGAGPLLSFTPKALQRVHRFTNGVPRLINLVCDRALLSAYALRLMRIVPEIVDRAAHMLDLEPPRQQIVPDWLRRRTAALAIAGIAAGLSAAALISSSSLVSRAPQADQQPETRLSRAFRELEQAMQADPRFAASGKLGVIRLEQPELAAALALFRTAGSLEAVAPDPVVDLMLPAGTAGQTNQAQESLLRTFVASSQGPTHYNLAVLYDRAGETARAAEHVERSVATTGRAGSYIGTRMRGCLLPAEKVLQ
jgi:type II secretory pathway predicted ATPase ExeA